MICGSELDGVVRDLSGAFESGRFGEPVVVCGKVGDDCEDLLGWRVNCDGGMDRHCSFLMWRDLAEKIE